MTCPATQQLQHLLDDALPANEQQTIHAHLEACPTCQATLERLAAGGATWDRAAQNLGQESKGGDTAMDDVVERLQKRTSDANMTQAETAGSLSEDELSFLQPADKPGVLGRLDHYEVHSIVGRGGFGIVLKAFDETLHRIVAIKVMAPALASHGAARQRFVREAKAAAAVSHENIVTIHAVAADAKIPYLVMQFISGVTLAEKIERQGAFSVREILRIGMQAAEGLAAAHKQGLIHRDIKPGNILLENGVERVKITDFGLARTAEDASVTQSGMIAGTPMFMSPEQANGEPIDARSDLFSLGSVLYMMCTGKPPFRAANTMAVLKRVCDDTPRPIRESNPDAPDWLADIITKLHAKKPADRFHSAREVADLLGRYLAQVQAQGAAAPAAGAVMETVTLRPAANAPIATTEMPKPAKAKSQGWILVLVIVLALCMLPAGFIAVGAIALSLVVIRPVAHEQRDPVAIEEGPRAWPKNAPPKPIDDAIVAPPAPLADYALRFDGQSSHVEIPTLQYDGDHPLTVEGYFTVKEARVPAHGLVALSGRVHFALSQGPSLQGAWRSSIVTKGQSAGWHTTDDVKPGERAHVAAVFDGKKIDLYVNGRPAPTVPYTPLLDGARAMGKPSLLGRLNYKSIETGTGRSFFGDMDEIRISRVARYTKDFTPRERFDPDKDTIALYHCDEGQGDKLVDASGNKHHGKVVGATWVKASRPASATARAETGILDYTEIHDADTDRFDAWIARMKKDGYRPATLSVQTVKDVPRYTAVAVKEEKAPTWDFTRDSPDNGAHLDEMLGKGYVPYADVVYREIGRTKEGYLWLKNPPFRFGGNWVGDLPFIQNKIGDQQMPRLAQRSGVIVDGKPIYAIVQHNTDGPPWVEKFNQSLPECKAWIEERSKQGWRPTHLYAYGDGAKTLFGNILTKDPEGPAWAISWSLTPPQYETELVDRKRQGYRPHSPVGHSDDSGALRFSLIWVRYQAAAKTGS